ncbi:unnamed protein product [Strongylus vulgaris]|uniref:Reverse transcriptase domain-containing protein n=1 Tax=Strongylus vulgaris TaxID=40348 RepID=A0A3P7LIA3_STRVU|nr:unnamed protein product [Strongylus vulgaris]
MKAATAPVLDDVPADLLRAGGHCLHEILAEYLTSDFQRKESLTRGEPLKQFLHKKGNEEGVRNYRSICVLSVLYKLSTKIILARISTVDEVQAVEQTGFRKGFSCRSHSILSRIIEVCRKYRLPLVLTFA